MIGPGGHTLPPLGFALGLGAARTELGVLGERRSYSVRPRPHQ